MVDFYNPPIRQINFSAKQIYCKPYIYEYILVYIQFTVYLFLNTIDIFFFCVGIDFFWIEFEVPIDDFRRKQK